VVECDVSGNIDRCRLRRNFCDQTMASDLVITD
jgi:hypothetical protein